MVINKKDKYISEEDRNSVIEYFIMLGNWII